MNLRPPFEGSLQLILGYRLSQNKVNHFKEEITTIALEKSRGLEDTINILNTIQLTRTIGFKMTQSIMDKHGL